MPGIAQGSKDSQKRIRQTKKSFSKNSYVPKEIRRECNSKHKQHMHPSSPAISPFLLVTITLIINGTEQKIYSSDNLYR